MSLSDEAHTKNSVLPGQTSETKTRVEQDVEQTSSIVNCPPDNLGEISLQELYRRVGDRSPIVVDVLPRESYISGHIPGAISLPLAEVNSRARELIPDCDAEIAVYCASAT